MDIDVLKNEKGKLIGTVVFSLLTSFFLFSTVFGYYFGLKAKAEAPEVWVYAEEAVPVNSIGVLENYDKINFTACSNTLASIFYKSTLVTTESLSNDEKLAILYYHFSNSCDSPITIATEDMNNAIASLFDHIDVGFVNTENFSVNNEGTQITISPLNCSNCMSEITRKITNATTSENNLYIYEEVYDGMNIVNYKWTYTKNAYNNYYFVSISNI